MGSYKGRIISASAPTTKSSLASAVWSLPIQMQNMRAGTWPGSAGGGSALFSFTTHTFTTASTTGRYGPTLATLQSAYSSQTWASNPSYFFQGRAQGYQVFQIPRNGVYEITVAGARGQHASSAGSGPSGAILRARFSLTTSNLLEMLVGQVPGTTGQDPPITSYAGAGGGTFVALYGTNTPLIVAGGGAGLYSSTTSSAIMNGQTRRRPRWTGYSYGPLSDGSDPPYIGYGAPGYHGGGGGGLLGPGTAYPGRTISDGARATDPSGQQYTAGAGFVGSASNPANDPVPGTWYGIGGNATGLPTVGGFGGGGGGHSGNNTGGGGGGYTGGPGGQTSLGGSITSGIGGGSFVATSATTVATSDGNYDDSSTFAGLPITNLGSYNYGSGYIIVTFIG